jgi:hypothetical protein
LVDLGRRGARQLVGQLEGMEVKGLTLLSMALVARASTRSATPVLAGTR